MRHSKHGLILGVVAIASTAGCGGGGETRAGAGAGGGTQKPQNIIALLVDMNRDGVADEKDLDMMPPAGGWSATLGASFLANLDDDDGDHVRDADDDHVNGDADALDLAPIKIAAWPDAPDGVTGTLVLDEASVPKVRIFKHDADGSWALVLGSVGPCTDAMAMCTPTPSLTLSTDEIRAGVSFGIEGRDFVRSTEPGEWTGRVTLGWTIRDESGAVVTSDAVPTGNAEVTMRVAPWILFGNLSPFDTIYSSSDSAAFVKGITAAETAAGGLTYTKYSSIAWDDQWTQDFFQTAWTAIPGPNGAVQGMRIANARPWGRDPGEQHLPITYLRKHYLGPDRGVLEIYKEPDTGDTWDSHGNHDLLPPYENGDQKFPLGRIVTGSNILPETGRFYDAQGPQSPHLVLDSSWLDVGHIDEFLSYVPAKTPRGWKLLVASPKLSRSMLEKAQADGNGGAMMFAGKSWYDLQDDYVDAQVTIDQVLANTDLMQWSQEAQTEIDANVDKLTKELGLAPDEIIEIPVLFIEYAYGKLAYQPGTVNLLAFGDYVVHPDPFGPVIGGVDIFKQDLLDRLGTSMYALGKDGQGLKVNFADDWEVYHILEGEVHCGSNVEASAPFADVRWWETGR
jgi:protein-arginine deiminase